MSVPLGLPKVADLDEAAGLLERLQQRSFYTTTSLEATLGQLAQL